MPKEEKKKIAIEIQISPDCPANHIRVSMINSQMPEVLSYSVNDDIISKTKLEVTLFCKL